MCRKILFLGALASAKQGPTVEILHSYPITSNVISDAVTLNPVNMYNQSMAYSSGGVSGNGYNNYASANLGFNVDKWFGISVWAERLVSFAYYQLLFGGPNYRTSGPNEYNWFIGLFNNKISQISSPIYGTAEPANIPFHVAATVNIVQRLLKVFRNGVQIYDGALTMGGYTGGQNLNILSIGGFTGFSVNYAAGARIHSVEVTAGQLTEAQAVELYQKGAL